MKIRLINIRVLLILTALLLVSLPALLAGHKVHATAPPTDPQSGGQSNRPSGNSPAANFPTLAQQLAKDKVIPGSALEQLIRENQDFSILRPEEANDKIRIPLWLRVYWRKAHPEGNYSGADPTGGYPFVLKEVHEWMLTHQDLKAGEREPLIMPGEKADPVIGANVRTSGLQSVARSESDIRINFFDPQKIIVASNNIGGSGAQGQYFSTDGGVTWGQTTLPFVSPDTLHSDPTVDWTSDGRAWSSTLGIQGANLRLRNYFSTDNGATWTFEATASGTQNSVDKQMVWIDHSPTSPFFNQTYAIWHNNAPVFMSRRTAGAGGTWLATPIQVSGAETTGTGIGADVKTNSFGDIFGSWPDTGSRRIVVVKSTNGGASYGSPVQITTSFGSFDIGIPSFNNRRALIYVTLGAYRTAAKNLVYATWTDLSGDAGCNLPANEPGANTASPCKTRIWFSRSTNGGTSWSTPVRINHQASLNDQFNQWLAVDETTGRIGIIYYDTVSDAGRKKTDIWYQESLDDGLTWGTAIKVTTAQTDETISGADSGNQYGDYNGLTAYNGVFYPSWTDRRNNAREEIWTAKISACTAPGTPNIVSATVPANNQIQVNWTNGTPASTTFKILRAIGNCASATNYIVLASGVSGTSYLDTTVSGGTTYAYKVVGVDSGGTCDSVASGCVSATATGVCTLAPTFAGLTSVTNAAAATCRLNLSWSAATAPCGGSITYNVYRSTTSGFVPSPGNLIATGLTGTSYNDSGSQLTNGTTFYYIVRAVDASNLSQETNSIERSGVPTGPIVVGTFTETFEGSQSGGGFDNAGWTHQAITEAVDWVWSTAQSHTPTHSWFSASQTIISDRVLVSPSLVINASTTLSFRHTFNFETDFDGGTLEISTNNGMTWSVMPDAAFTAGGFTSTISTGFGNPIGGSKAWSGGAIGAMTQVTVNLASFAGQTAKLRWHAGDDDSNAEVGWFVDSVTLTNAGIPSSCTSSPTAVTLISFNAESYDNGVFLEWQTGFEVSNLGFNLYREENGRRERLNRQIVAGSSLTATASLFAGETYAWWDKTTGKAAAYWLEDMDLNGYSTWHGPFYSKAVGGAPPSRSQASALSGIGNRQAQTDDAKVTETVAVASRPTAADTSKQAIFAGQAAIKIVVNREGWYRLSQAELGSAGLGKDVDATLLQMYADGREIPVSTTAGKDGRFDETASLEFYGVGLDTPATDKRVYWLVIGKTPGLRIRATKGEGAPATSRSFTQTIERKDRTIYFAALKNGDKENFFGAVVTPTPVEQTLALSNLDLKASERATLEVTLQGVTNLPHRVLVEINGTSVGEVIFIAQDSGTGKFSFAHTLLREGTNSVRLTAENSTADVSLVDCLRLSYQHIYTADNDALKFSALGRQEVTIGGFTSNQLRVFDVTNADAVQELTGRVQETKGIYSVTVAATENGLRSLVAMATEQARRPLAISANRPSNLRDSGNAADFLIISRSDLLPAFEQLQAIRESNGIKTMLVDIEDIYDEFNFGNKAPQSVKDFLLLARSSWTIKPRFVMLAADASFDARNYLGLGDADSVPTKLLDTEYLETASDDWFADFNNDGTPEIAVGRLPVGTIEEATQLVSKILFTDRTGFAASALLVSDANDSYNFELASEQVKPILQAKLTVEELQRGRLEANAAKARLLDALNRGQRFVNYNGHGSAELWRGNLLSAQDARNLSNARLPIFVMMTCLNGYFHAAGVESLAESLLKAERGGAVAVWTSSGLSLPQEHALMSQAFYRALDGATLGEAARQAKSSISNQDIRRTWILLGDPTMRVK